MLTGGFDSLYALGSVVTGPSGRPGRLTRRDLLLQVGELDRWTRAVARGGGRPRAARTNRAAAGRIEIALAAASGESNTTVEHPPGSPRNRERSEQFRGMDPDVRLLAAGQSQAARPVVDNPVQLALDLDDAPGSVEPSGLPEMTGAELVRAELEVLGLDATRHVVDFYEPFLAAIRATRAPDLVRRRSQAEVLVAGVKVATQTPPIRSGRRVVFVTLDDARGPVDATFFEDAQGPYAATLFHSWLLVIRGHVRRTGPRGVSLRATGCWELTELHAAWQAGGLDAVAAAMAATGPVTEEAIAGAAESRSPTTSLAALPMPRGPRETATPREVGGRPGGGMGNRPGVRRVLVHPSGFRQSPYADLRPPGDDTKTAARKEGAKAPRKLWHSSPGSSGG